jgi:hypothetical protein
VFLGMRGVISEIPPFNIGQSNPEPSSGQGTMAAGQFYWGGILLKSNGGARRWAQHSWQLCVECKGTSPPNCETYKSSRYESRP